MLICGAYLNADRSMWCGWFGEILIRYFYRRVRHVISKCGLIDYGCLW